MNSNEKKAISQGWREYLDVYVSFENKFNCITSTEVKQNVKGIVITRRIGQDKSFNQDLLGYAREGMVFTLFFGEVIFRFSAP